MLKKSRGTLEFCGLVEGEAKLGALCPSSSPSLASVSATKKRTGTLNCAVAGGGGGIRAVSCARMN
jgi:hypothetical protein